MLVQYQRKANVAAGVWIASLVPLVALAVVASDGTRGILLESPLGLTIFVVNGCAYFYAFWAYAKAKGYSGFVGVVLPIFSLVGLLILITLRDKHKDDSHSASDSRTNEMLHSVETMSFRLNGWQRIGVVLSLLWVMLVCGYAAYEYIDRGAGTQLLIEVIPDKLPVIDKSDRVIDYIVLRSGEPSIRIGRVLAALIVPLFVGWALTYLCVIAVRWVGAGFKNGT